MSFPMNSPFIRGALVKTGQGYFCLDPNEQFVSRHLIEHGQFGLHEIAQARHLAGPDARILVVGAHIGSICIPLSRHCKELVAIEANPDTYEFLILNIRMNQCLNLSAYHLAANHDNSEIEFVMSTVNSGGSKRMPLHKDHAYFYDNPKVTKVRGQRLDELFTDPKFDLVFMDIEGSEYFAFLGMPNILAATKHLVVEYLPHHLSRVGGIDVETFLTPLKDNFSTLHVPSQKITVNRDQFYPLLKEMFDKGVGDEGIVFSK